MQQTLKIYRIQTFGKIIVHLYFSYFQNEIKALKQKQHEGAEFSSAFTSEEASHPAILRLSSDGKMILFCCC